MNDEKLVALVEGYGFLYDKTARYYRDKVAKENAWEAISKQMQTPADACTKRWNSLRERFSREVKQYTPSGSANDGRAPWHLYSAMSFLESQVKPRHTRYSTNVLVKGSPETIPANWEILEEEFVGATSLSSLSSDACMNAITQGTSTNKRKRQGNDVDNALLEALNSFRDVCQEEKEPKDEVLEGFCRMLKALIGEMSVAKRNQAINELSALAWSINAAPEN